MLCLCCSMCRMRFDFISIEFPEKRIMKVAFMIELSQSPKKSQYCVMVPHTVEWWLLLFGYYWLQSHQRAWRSCPFTVVSTTDLHIPSFPWSPSIFSQYYELSMVKDPNSLLSSIEKYSYWNDEVWHKMVNHHPSLLAKTEPLIDAHFTPNHNTFTCYQITCKFWIIYSVTWIFNDLFSLILIDN